MQEDGPLQNDGIFSGFLALPLDEQGATAVEYALIAALIVVAISGVMMSFSESVIRLFNDWSSAVINAINGG